MNGFQVNSKACHWIKFTVSQLLWNMDDISFKIKLHGRTIEDSKIILSAKSSVLAQRLSASSQSLPKAPRDPREAKPQIHHEIYRQQHHQMKYTNSRLSF